MDPQAKVQMPREWCYGLELVKCIFMGSNPFIVNFLSCAFLFDWGCLYTATHWND